MPHDLVGRRAGTARTPARCGASGSGRARPRRLVHSGDGPAPAVRAADRADAGQGLRRLPDGRRLAVRAQVGRLPGPRLPRRRRGLHRSPRPEAARPLLPGARRSAARGAARALRAGRRGRHRPRRGARLRGAAAAHPPGGVAGQDARRGDRRRRSSPGTCSRSATRTCATVPQGERRARLEAALGGVERRRSTSRRRPATGRRPRTGSTASRAPGSTASIAKRLDGAYQPGKRAMLKIKHQRTADCVVAGFRWHKNGPGTHVGSLLLGLYDDAGALHHVGVTSSFTWDRRARAGRGAGAAARERPRRPSLAGVGRVGDDRRCRCVGAAPARAPRRAGTAARTCPGSRFARERVVEVAYDHLQGDRFRHGTTFKRWRPDKPTGECRYDQLETSAPYLLAAIFGAVDAGGPVGHRGPPATAPQWWPQDQVRVLT